MSRERLPGSVTLSGMEVSCRVGALPGETDRPQAIRVTLTAHLDLGEAAASDALRDALDYRELAEIVRRMAGRGPYQLLESLGGVIADEVLRLGRVESVEVGLEKLRPPLGPEVGAIVVRLRRDKGDLTR